MRIIIIEGASEAVLAALLAQGMRMSLPSHDGGKTKVKDVILTEDMSKGEQELLEKAMQHTHQSGDTPLVDSLTPVRLNRSEALRQYIKEHESVTFDEVVKAMVQKYPHISAARWDGLVYSMTNPNQGNYTLKRTGYGKQSVLSLL